jgi:hypothetical protein
MRLAFWGMLFFNGLAVANHMQGVLTTPVLAVVVGWALYARKIRIKDALVGGGIWLLGSLPYTWLVTAELAHTGNLVATIRSATVGERYGGNVLNAHFSMRLVAIAIGFPLLNFPNLLLPAAGYGMARARRIGVPAVAWRALLAALIVHAVFVVRYSVPDQHTFFLPTYVLLCIFGGIGAAAVLAWPPAARRLAAIAAVLLLLATPLVYWGVATAGRRFDLLRGAVHHKPYRDDYTYLLIPWGIADPSAERLSRHAVELAGVDGLILVEDEMAAFAIEYQAIRSPGKHLEIRGGPGPQGTPAADALNQEMRRTAAAGRRVVLVPGELDRPPIAPPVGRWVRDGDLYVLDANGISAGLGGRPG